MSEEKKDDEVRDLKPEKEVKGGGGLKSQSGGGSGIGTQPIPNPNQ
jgi:hypothetical protein